MLPSKNLMGNSIPCYKYIINSQFKSRKEEAQALQSLRATKGFRRVSNITNTYIKLPQLNYCKNLLGLAS